MRKRLIEVELAATLDLVGKALDRIRSVYELSHVDLTSKPLRVERRSGARRVTDVKVCTYDGVDIRKCRLLDIGLDGAFFDTKTFALPLVRNIELVLKFGTK